MNFLIRFIPRAVGQGIPLMFGSVGETLTEKSGHLNLGTAGIMYVGGICGVIGAFFTKHRRRLLTRFGAFVFLCSVV